jgi:DNA-binding MurR/RpiR family transcriptional regulator
MLAARLQKSYASLTEQQKKVAEYFLAQGPEAAFLSVAELASRVKTSQATIVRFARAIGFTGYLQLQQELRESVRQMISPTRGLQSMMSRGPKDDVYSRIFEMDVQNICTTREANGQVVLEEAVTEIVKARKVGLVGYRTSHAIAYLLYYYLNRVRNNCELLDTGANLTNQLVDFGDGDLLVAVSLPRYSRHTIDVLKYGKKLGTRVLTITDVPISPAGQISDMVLLVSRQSATYFNSYTSAVTVVNCLAAGVSLKDRRSVARLKAFDRVDEEWKRFML